MIKFISKGGIDTSDATALAEDIREGKTAYVATGKVEGTANIGVLSSVDYETCLQLCDDIKGNPPPTEGHIYGVRRPLDGISLERTDDAKGKTAIATHNGEPVQNDFDTLEPWASIKSFNYDSSKEEITAWFGDSQFTFTPEDPNVNVFTRIPRFWYKRYKDEQYEYWKIADYAAEGFNEFAGCSPARYGVSGSDNNPRSISGVRLSTIMVDNCKTALENLSSYIGLLDIWTVGIIQMLYLIEYADANSQTVLGQGRCYTNSTSSFLRTGDCNELGMKSGCMLNDKKSSVMYRGFEDIFGSLYEFVDGINIINNQAWVCEDWTKYNSTNTNDYKQLSYINASTDNYGKELGLDEIYPLVMIPTVVSSSGDSFTKDYYKQTKGNRAMRLGGGYYQDNDKCGLFCARYDSDNGSSGSEFGTRFLLHKIS